MDRILPHQIEAVLLYEDHDYTFESNELLELLNSSVSDPQFQFHRTPFENEAAGYLHYFGAGISIQITQSQTPLRPDGFQSALSSEFTRITFPEAPETVKNHKKHTFITMTCGVPVPDMPEFEEKLGMELPRSKFEPNHFDFVIKLLRVLVTTFTSKTIPTAIHWVQSDRLISYPQYLDVELDQEDLSLLVHPSLFSSGKNVDGSNCIGFRTYGAKNLIGKEIQFQESHVNFLQLYVRALIFISMVRKSGKLIADGDSFGKDETEIIRVRHLDDKHDPAGIIQLTLERSAEFGINMEPTLEEEIAKQAEEKRIAEAAAIEAAEAKVTRFKLSDTDKEDPALRANIAAMRNLTKKSEASAQQSKKKRFGLF